MKSKYLNEEQIVVRLKADTIEQYLEFNPYGYEFLGCEDCDGPRLGHVTNKCTSLEESYDKKTVAKFKEWLRNIPEFRKQLKDRAIKIADGAVKTQADIMSRVMRDTQEARNTTQLVKPRWPPGWTGQ